MLPWVGPSLYPGSIKLKAIKTHRLVFLESQKKLWTWTLYDALCVKGQHEGVVHHEQRWPESKGPEAECCSVDMM